MPGYEIFESRFLKTYKDDGIEPYDTKIGFIDFLREIKNEARDIPKLSSFMVIGIDDVIYITSRENRLKVSREIHNILQSASSTLQRKNIQVQIVCKGKLKKGDSLSIEYRGEKLDLDNIFGSTSTHDIRGINVYITGYNLSS